MILSFDNETLDLYFTVFPTAPIILYRNLKITYTHIYLYVKCAELVGGYVNKPAKLNFNLLRNGSHTDNRYNTKQELYRLQI